MPPANQRDRRAPCLPCDSPGCSHFVSLRYLRSACRDYNATFRYETASTGERSIELARPLFERSATYWRDSFFSISFRAWSTCSANRFGFRPSFAPRHCADSRPRRVRSAIRLRSSSASAPIGCHAFRATGIRTILGAAGGSQSRSAWPALRPPRPPVPTAGAMMTSASAKSKGLGFELANAAFKPVGANDWWRHCRAVRRLARQTVLRDVARKRIATPNR